MNVLLFCEYPRRYPWSPTRWAMDISAGLIARGHGVTMACDGAEESAMLAPATVLLRRPLRDKDARAPVAFHRWAGRVRRCVDHDASLSLSRLVAADAWLPVGPAALASYRAAVEPSRPASAAVETLHRLWLPSAVLGEWLARRDGRRSVRAAVGPFGAGFGPGSISLGFASALARPGDAERADLRRRVRALLGLPEHRRAVLLSATRKDGAAIGALLGAIAELSTPRAGRETGPVLLVVGHHACAVHAAARRAGCETSVRVLGATARMDAAFAACDIGAAPWARLARGGGETGRFIADALRCGRPVVAHRRAPGAEMLLPGGGGDGGGTARPGLVVESHDIGRWLHALREALRDDWLAKATAAAGLAGEGVSMEAWIGRLERVLMDRGATVRERAVREETGNSEQTHADAEVEA